MPESPDLTDPTSLARFGKLEVVTRLLVEGFMMGQHKSPFKGSSVEFVEHRQYYPGDEIRHIDWRAFGKTGKYYIKEFEEETNLRSYLLVDASGSMKYGQSTISKFEYARLTAAALGYMLINQRDAVGLRIFDTHVRDALEPSARPQQFQHVIEHLENTEPGDETSLAEVFAELIPRLKRRSLILIFSDLFDDLKPLTTALKQFRHARHEVLLFQVVAPEEETFPFRKPTQFRNLENLRHRMLVDPHRLRAEYRERFQKFTEELTRTCGNARVDLCRLRTDQPIQKALGHFLDQRARLSIKR